MRVVVFTGDPHLEESPWWRILVETPAVESILICRRVFSGEPREVLRRFRRNVKKHGLIFVPFRVAVLMISIAKRPFRKAEPSPPPLRSVHLEEIEALDIHSPEVIERVRAFNADLGASLGAPVLKAPLFRLPRLGTVNLHLGKVPDFRGAPPAFWELVKGANTVGATIHWVDEGLDTGAVIASGEAPIYPTDRLSDVEARAEELGARLLRQAFDAVARGDAPSRPQPTGGATNRFPTLRQRWSLHTRLWRRRIARKLEPRRVTKFATMAFGLYVYRPIRDVVRTMTRRHPVRVFTFHRVTDLCRDGMTVSAAVFREQVRYLARHSDIVSLERGVAMIREGARLSRPAAVITFDDAYRTVFTAARPVLAEAGVTGCCFVSTDLVGTDSRFEHDADNLVRPHLDVMDWDQLRELRDAGWSFGAHTATHARLSACIGATLQREIEEPRRALRDQLGVEADVLAYPFGDQSDISDEAQGVAQRAGHTTIFRNFAGENRTGNTGLMLGRFDIGAYRDAIAWKNQTHGIDLSRWRGLWRP